MATIFSVSAEIQFRHLYTCHKCGTKGAGDKRSTQVVGLGNSQALAAHVDRIAANATAMPMGWSSNYAPKADYFLCPDCN